MFNNDQIFVELHIVNRVIERHLSKQINQEKQVLVIIPLPYLFIQTQKETNYIYKFEKKKIEANAFGSGPIFTDFNSFV